MHGFTDARLFLLVGGKVDGEILFSARSEKPKILFGATGEKRTNLFGAKWQLRQIYLAVKGLIMQRMCKIWTKKRYQVFVIELDTDFQMQK